MVVQVKIIKNQINTACTTIIRLKQHHNQTRDLSKLCTINYYYQTTKKGHSQTIHLSHIMPILCKILHIFWPKTISNKNLQNITQQDGMHSTIKRCRWSWIDWCSEAIPRVALHWTPEGKRKKWWPKMSWRWTIEKELHTNRAGRP